MFFEVSCSILQNEEAHPNIRLFFLQAVLNEPFRTISSKYCQELLEPFLKAMVQVLLPISKGINYVVRDCCSLLFDWSSGKDIISR